MADQLCEPGCGHPRRSHSIRGCLHDGKCVYGCTKTYEDLTRRPKK
jgi:hypothetical protein